MKILVIHDDSTIPGGTNVYRKEFSNLLRRRGMEVFLFTYNLKDDEDLKHSYCYHYNNSIKFLRHMSHNYLNPALFISLKRWIRKVKPDLIHIHHNYIFTTSVLLACRGQAPILQTVHDHRMVCPSGRGLTTDGNLCEHSFGIICYRKGCLSLKDCLLGFFPRYIEKFLLKKNAVTFLVPSEHLKKKMEAYGFDTTLLPLYIDAAHYPLTQPDPEGYRILFAGCLREGKGIGILLEAFSKVLERIPSATLDLVGNDESDRRFERLANSLHLDGRATFHGLIPHFRLHEFYEKTNLVVLPSASLENSPLVILEAMASARPVIGTRIGGIPEMIIEGKNGLLCTPGNPDDLSKKILQLLLDKEKAQKMGMRGRSMVEMNYGLNQHLGNYLQIIRRIT